MPACFHLSVVDTKIYDRRTLDHPTAPPIFNVGSHNSLMQSLLRNRFDRSFRDDRNMIELSANPATSRSFDTFDSLTINIASGSKMEADECCATDECCSSGRFDCGSLYYLHIILYFILYILFYIITVLRRRFI